MTKLEEIGKLMHKHSFECGYSDTSKDSKNKHNDFGIVKMRNPFINLVCLSPFKMSSLSIFT